MCCNGDPSPGKDFTHTNLIRLARKSAWKELDGSFTYFDIINTKFLVLEGRYHSDNRAGIIGRGSDLGTTLRWLAASPRNRGTMIAIAIYLFDQLLRRNFPNSQLEVWREVPYELSPIMGGLNWPGYEWEIFNVKFGGILNYLWFCHQEQDSNCLRTLFRLSALAGKSRYGFDIPIMDYLAKSVSDWTVSTTVPIAEEVDSSFGIGVSFKTDVYDINEKVLYPSNIFLKYFDSIGQKFEASPFSGLPRIVDFIKSVKEKFSCVPLDIFANAITRTKVFESLFTKGLPNVAKLNIHKYFRKASCAFRELPVASTAHGFKGYDDLYYKIRFARLFFVRTEALSRLVPKAVPSLRVHLSDSIRRRPSAMGSDVTQEAFASYITEIGSERGLPTV
jgi:hypothetical protein